MRLHGLLRFGHPYGHRAAASPSCSDGLVSLRNDCQTLPYGKRHWKLMSFTIATGDSNGSLQLDRFMHVDITFTMLGDEHPGRSALHVKCMSRVETQWMSV